MVPSFYQEERGFLKELCRDWQNFYESETEKVLVINEPPRHGKLIADDEPVLTADGWKRHGDLVVGDRVIAPNGKFVKVTHVHPKGEASLRVTMTNGATIDVHPNHEWVVYDRYVKKTKTVETKWLQGKLNAASKKSGRGHRYRFQLPPVSPVVGEEKELPVHPYVFGAWLGDGTNKEARICAHPDDVIVLEECAKHDKKGYTAIHKDTSVITQYDYELKDGLREMGLCYSNERHEKYIPDTYLTASVEQRLELLAGLLDTDGHLRRKENRYIFTTAESKLRDTFCELIATFGWRTCVMNVQPRLSTSGIQGKHEYWQIGFNPDMEIPCRIERKRIHTFSKRRKYSIASITPLEKPVQGNCITVEGGVYLVGKLLVPTHNSLTAQLFSCWVFGKNPQEKIITGSYNEQLSKTFSRNVRDRINERKAEKDKIVYSDIFPKTKIKKGNSAANLWALSGQYASYLATSPGGTVTGFGCSCFPAGTMILTPDGNIDISRIEVGQEVYSYNHETNKAEIKKVRAIRTKYSNNLVKVMTHNHQQVCSTADHRFWTDGNYFTGIEKSGYVEARSLKDGDKLCIGWFGTKIFNAHDYVAWVLPVKGTELVYDIEVEGNHNFYANHILVHNCMIIDDIVKNAEEAMNEIVLEGHYEWFVNTMLSRLEKGGKIIIIATRWATKDLSGRIIEHYNSINVPIRVIVKKALQDDGTMLCPEILDRKSYDLISKTMGQEIVRANYDQRPIDITGRLYNVGFDTYTKLPTDDRGQSVIEEVCAYIDTADQGDDYLCMIIYGLYRGQAYVLDVYFTKEGMEITEPETAKRLKEYSVNRAFAESNNGGRGFARSVERILREKHHWYKTYIDMFTQHRNKKARILSSATWCQQNIKFPAGWEVNYNEFYLDVMGYQREGKMKHDDAEDVLAGIYDRVGRGNLFSFS